MHFSVQVEIGHHPGIADPQGAAIERALPGLGYANVSAVGVGKIVRFEVECVDESTAYQQVDEMCQRLLANPVIETYAITCSPVEMIAPRTSGPGA